MHISKRIAIIGGGPAGLIAAEMLANNGCQVTIYDRMPLPGRKFLMAGRGGLNLTHSEPLDSFITRYGLCAAWLSPYIHAFPPDTLRKWCEDLGQETFVGTSGRVFPRAMKAAPLLRAWLRRLESLGVAYVGRHYWCGWHDEALRFIDAANQEYLVRPDATLLALGGASWPHLGSDGGWTAILANHGVTMTPLRPANCGFIVAWSDYFSGRFAGTPLKSVTVSYGETSRQGELMITKNGIEGGPVYALSQLLRDAIETNGHATLALDLRPTMTQEALSQRLRDCPRGSQSLSSYLRKMGFSPLAINLLRETTPPELLAKANYTVLAQRLKSLPLTLHATSGMDRAISTAGGITRESLDEYLMLRAMPGVFAAGEMLDWEAPTGGYLLQGCFSTGVAAAEGIMRYLANAPNLRPAS